MAFGLKDNCTILFLLKGFGIWNYSLKKILWFKNTEFNRIVDWFISMLEKPNCLTLMKTKQYK